MSSTKSNLLEYLGAFDGTKKDFSEVEHLFDALYHDPFRGVSSDGEKISRRQVQQQHAAYLSKGYCATLAAFKWIGLESVYVNIRLTNDEGDIESRVVFTVLDGKLVDGELVKISAESKVRKPLLDLLRGAVWHGAPQNRQEARRNGAEYKNERLFAWIPTPSGNKYVATA